MVLVIRSVMVELEIYAKAKAKAEKEGTTISKVIRQGLTSYVEG